MRIANYHIRSANFVANHVFVYSYDEKGKTKYHTDEFVCIMNAKCYLQNAICNMLFAKSRLPNS